ncbi:MAG: hypothetical protein LH702_14095 [Phormidesmis sp. CAN_BIN44]|nr:hypothetical protein [Phormidesmis sp. CAN_BIN44]
MAVPLAFTGIVQWREFLYYKILVLMALIESDRPCMAIAAQTHNTYCR